MFSINLEYPSFKEEVEVVKNTTTDIISKASSLLSAKEIIEIQHLIRRVPVATNVIEYAVSLVTKTRPNSTQATELVNRFVDWGAGPRASQNLILGAKAMAAVRGKYSPDIEDVQAVAIPILSHRIVKNYKAEAENISVAEIIKSLL
jgi:MoxR-like ATPase